MKKALLALVLVPFLSFSAQAALSCSSAVVEADKASLMLVIIDNAGKALVTDLRVSKEPRPYTCSKSESSDDDQVLVQYTCQGDNDSKEAMALFVNLSTKKANYKDKDEDLDLDDLDCQIN